MTVEQDKQRKSGIGAFTSQEFKRTQLETGSPTSTDNCGDGAKLWNPEFDRV